jgi:formylglycine-generating enzyme required for sulfatase activity
MMGCSPGDNECFGDEKPPKSVNIANGFWLGQTEVTQAAWKKVNKGSNPSNFKSDQLPVENVSWDYSAGYCRAIGGRLPTEQEWEYAARAGTTGARYGALDSIAWYDNDSGGTTHPVGLKRPNAFGLYDMLGNVWEWTDSNYDDKRKVVRGCSWYSNAKYARASNRDGDVPTYRYIYIGFRCELAK